MNQAADPELLALVADDEPVVAALVSELLTEAGATVIGPGRDGTQALRLWEQHRPRLVVLDFQMPGLTGLEVLRAIRDHERQNREPHPCFVVILSMHAEPAIVQRCLEEGADRYLNKQADFERLLEIVPLVAAQTTRPT